MEKRQVYQLHRLALKRGSMKQIIFVSLALLATVSGGGDHVPALPEPTEPAIPYTFGYKVEDAKANVHFGRMESSNGEVITGTYRVILSDGRIQTVKYTADDANGYVATVTYERSPISVPAPAFEHVSAYDMHSAPIPYSHQYYHH